MISITKNYNLMNNSKLKYGHQFINNSSEILQILDIVTREKDDINNLNLT